MYALRTLPTLVALAFVAVLATVGVETVARMVTLFEAVGR